MSGGEKSTQVWADFAFLAIYLNQLALQQSNRRQSHVRRSLGHLRTDLIAAVGAGRWLLLPGVPMKSGRPSNRHDR
jgi:hypothetical protein